MTTRLEDPDDYPKLVVVAAGPSECGKTRALVELFLAAAPRRVSIDFIGEVRRKYSPTAVEVFSIAELREQLAAVAHLERWHIALCTDPESIPDMAPELGRMLNPARSSSAHKSFPKLVGGIAIDCSEGRNFVPNSKVAWASHTVAMFERGRHNCLSMFIATQAPQSIERRVTDAANILLAFRTQEKVVRAFWSDLTSDEVATLVRRLPAYHCAWIEKDRQVVYLLDERRNCYAVLDYDGKEIDDPAPAPAASDLDDMELPVDDGGPVDDVDDEELEVDDVVPLAAIAAGLSEPET